jgi:hypothetical protein
LQGFAEVPILICRKYFAKNCVTLSHPLIRLFWLLCTASIEHDFLPTDPFREFFVETSSFHIAIQEPC